MLRTCASGPCWRIEIFRITPIYEFSHSQGQQRNHAPQQNAFLFGLVGATEQRRQHFQAERLGGFEISSNSRIDFQLATVKVTVQWHAGPAPLVAGSAGFSSRRQARYGD